MLEDRVNFNLESKFLCAHTINNLLTGFSREQRGKKMKIMGKSKLTYLVDEFMNKFGQEIVNTNNPDIIKIGSQKVKVEKANITEVKSFIQRKNFNHIINEYYVEVSKKNLFCKQYLLKKIIWTDLTGWQKASPEQVKMIDGLFTALGQKL